MNGYNYKYEWSIEYEWNTDGVWMDTWKFNPQQR
jgi:hypothetical protein